MVMVNENIHFHFPKLTAKENSGDNKVEILEIKFKGSSLSLRIAIHGFQNSMKLEKNEHENCGSFDLLLIVN